MCPALPLHLQSLFPSVDPESPLLPSPVSLSPRDSPNGSGLQALTQTRYEIREKHRRREEEGLSCRGQQSWEPHCASVPRPAAFHINAHIPWQCQPRTLVPLSTQASYSSPKTASPSRFLSCLGPGTTTTPISGRAAGWSESGVGPLQKYFSWPHFS